MTAPLDAKGNVCVPNRRTQRRQKVLFSSLTIGENHSGRVLDISPKGIALETGPAAVGDECPGFSFKFSTTLAWVSARGRVVWRNQSNTVVGIEFIGLTDDVRGQIQTWMDSKKELSGLAAVILGPPSVSATVSATATSHLTSAAAISIDPSTEHRSPVAILPPLRHPTEAQDGRTPAKSTVRENIAGATNKARWRVGLAVTTATLLALFLLPQLHLRELWNSKNSTEMARDPHPAAPALGTAPTLQTVPSSQQEAPAEHPAPLLSQPAASALRLPVPTPNRQPTLQERSYVLQVAAMIHEENADELADSLRRMNLPALVMKMPDSRFHHVLVGPYNSADAATVKNDLEKRGFQVMRNEWKATGQ